MDYEVKNLFKEKKELESLIPFYSIFGTKEMRRVWLRDLQRVYIALGFMEDPMREEGYAVDEYFANQEVIR